MVVCSNLISCCCDKPLKQKQLEKERVYSIAEGSQSGCSRKTVPPRKLFEADIMKERCSCGFLPGSHSTAFFLQPRSTCLGIIPPSIDWSRLHQLAAKKIPTDTPVGLSDEDISSVEVPRCDKLITRISHHVMSVTLITVPIREALSVTAAVIGP